MKKHVLFHRLLIFIISAAMILNLTSCTQEKKPIPQTSDSSEEQNKPPKELDDLKKAVEKLEKTLFDMHERSKKPLFIQQSELQKQEKDQSQQEQSSQEQQSQSSESQESSTGQQPSQVQLVTPQDKLLEPELENQQMKLEVERATLEQFEQLKKDVIELHSLWNSFEAKAVNQFLLQTSLLDFENALNGLTKSIESKDLYQSLMDVIQLYKYIPDFYSAYTFETPPEIGKIRYGAKKIVLLTEKNKYPEAKETLDYITGVWMLTRPKLPKESIDKINQMEFSISDLNDAIEEKNATVVKAKTEVMLKIADELEKSSEEKSQ